LMFRVGASGPLAPQLVKRKSEAIPMANGATWLRFMM